MHTNKEAMVGRKALSMNTMYALVSKQLSWQHDIKQVIQNGFSIQTISIAGLLATC